MSQLLQTLKRGWTVLREEGPVSFVRQAREYLRRVEISTSGIEVSYQTGTRVDFEERLALLDEAVPEDADSLLDLGCAEGHLTAEFADRGLFSIGVERQAHVVASARRSNAGHPNLGFLQYEITPETIDTLPQFEVVFLLTVYHHWVNEFGWEDAEAMLRSLGSTCDTLVFENPDRPVDRPALDGVDGEDTAAYFTAYFETVFDGDVTVEFLGRTDYKGEERDDILCAVDTAAVGRSTTSD
jgi:SAM-dependent methyltransferase